MQEKKDSIRDIWTRFKRAPSIEEENLLKWLEDHRTKWLENRKKEYDRTWLQSLAFYKGDHYVRSSPNPSPYRARVKENHTNNALNRMLSIFAQNLPITRVFPNSIQDEDLRDAETTEAWLKYCYRKHQFELKYQKWVKYALVFGNGFLFRGFDFDASGEIMLDRDETPDGQSRMAEWSGDVKAEVDDPFRLVFRPGVEDMADHFDLVRSVPSNRSMLEAEHGPIDADTAKGYSLAARSVFEDPEVVMVHHYYHKPSAWFPEGLYACWAGKKLLKIREYPEHVRTLPVSHLPFDKPPMHFYGVAPIEQVMDLQEQLDKAASMIVEARNLIARPRVLASVEAQVPGSSLSDQPGAIVRYKVAGGKPEFHSPSFNFRELAEHKADVRNALNQVVGITSASRGEIPQAARTALALQLVLEQDRSQYLPFIKTLHAGLIEFNYGLCELARAYISEDDPRAIKIEGQTANRNFSGALVPNPLDIYLEDSNPLGWTAAGRIEQVGFLIDKGVITDRNQLLEMLQLNSADPASEIMRINRQSQEKEIELLEQGQILDIMPEDDDAVHLDVLTRVVASFAFRYKPEAVRAAYLDHIQKHKMRFAQGMAGQPGPGGQAAPAGPGGPPRAGSITPEDLSSLQPPGATSMDELLAPR